MKDSAPQAVFLSDYTPPAYLVDRVSLVFRLDPAATRVLSRIEFRPNPAAAPGQPLRLDGEKLRLIRAAVAGTALEDGVCAHSETGLTIPADRLPDGPFLWEAEVEIDPAGNTALEGLYMSNGMYCTQCEAEGFRKITYYPDRPDVMAPFDVRIESDQPVLLSNGNRGAAGDGFAEWSDPWPKPAYLFALVAGDLRAVKDRFTTKSGREVELGIYVRPGDEGKCDYALDALKRSMKWDEDVYGREYDLAIFNIVAVDDFNMGAMENKGLNIFNSKYVLASPDTATDGDYENVEGIIAHEYFHNWTGNRITCRDWFQLCLKEGLTVFRDQQFSSDMRSAPVKRIGDVLALRARQFREDNGPLAHPVRPSSYIEINNFYTATVYEKGAEVIGMLKRLVGDAGYARALDLYFRRHDGDAATIEDWLKVFEDATDRDLTQFGRWYTQAGTPRLHVTEDFKDGCYTLHIKQETPPTPGQPAKAPQVIPIAVGLLNPNGDEVVPTTVLEMTEAEQSFTFENLAARPVPSILRDFSAPVILERTTSTEERAFLLAHDTDPFNKWEAGRALAKDVLARMVTDNAAPGPAYLDALERVARDDGLDPAFRALALRLPSEDDMAQTLFDAGVTPDPLAIHAAREKLMLAMAEHLSAILPDLYEAMNIPGPYAPDARAAGCRALRQTALGLLSRLDHGKAAAKQYRDADNMTEQLGALGALLTIGAGQEEVGRFYRQWEHDRLVIDKWFALQTSHAAPHRAAETAQALTRHKDFDWKNPNRFRSVIGALAMNAAGFHDPSGASYELVADWLIRLDPVNPQTTARMTTMFETWRRYDADRQDLMRDALRRIARTPELSRDTTEMVGRILGDD
ncbi:aminopeptidase N [Psychromarinibacter sp. C21-152]|uniref:Aminopeptidase N n=1 Tax=Psychromarinibacter sediminicola TaxID=3033385 RepID=A0AAE3NP57_9RHOB|nr:aminopeptidase N [Psychromarinibacter sediminicola]MDF0599899.1 aminopeptidase N [Psychromarinibacter sediminicola]